MNYENFFCSSHQSTDLMSSMHVSDHDMAPQMHCFNPLPDDLQSQNQHQQSHHQPLIPTIQQQQQQHSAQSNGGNPADSILASHHNNNNNTSKAANPASNTFNNIPFVQIHTTDVQPQRNSFGNVFRRSTANLEEIKSEPIKSESTDGNKERVFATSTPLVRSSSCSSSSGERVVTPAHTVNNGCLEERAAPVEKALNASETASKKCLATFPVLQKCRHCPFLSLSDADLEAHMSETHSNIGFTDSHTVFRKRLLCPGCANIFYAHNSLLVHLHEDHLMTTQNAKILIEAVVQEPCATSQRLNQSNETTSNISTNESPLLDQQPRSRIYLKNVECLREPQRDCIGQEHQIAENFFFENDCNDVDLANVDVVAAGAALDDASIMELLEAENFERHQIGKVNNNNVADTAKSKSSLHATKQKISIKSVDVLREPAFLQRDYEMQNFSNYRNDSDGDQQMHCEGNQFDFDTAPDNTGSIEMSLIDHAENQYDNLPHPKIYIRNVDILKKPMLLPNNLSVPNLPESNSGMNFSYTPQTGVQYQNSADGLPSTPQVYDANITLTEPYHFEQANSNFMSNNAENFAYANSVSNNGFLLDNMRYSNELECGLDSSHSSCTTPIITEPTPPPPLPPPTSSMPSSSCLAAVATVLPAAATVTAIVPQQKQKIFIKNVDVLKAPQFQEPRGTLHLRTVDELNLMNKNEVENLIAPNLDNTSSVGSMNGTIGHSELPDELIYADGNCFKLHDFDEQVVNNWADHYDLGEDLDCIMTNEVVEAAITPPKAVVHDLDTPQTSLISIRDIEELTGATQNDGSADCVFEVTIVPTEQQEHLKQTSATVEGDLKQERMAVKCMTSAAAVPPATEKSPSTSKTATKTNFCDVPPLAPVTKTSMQSFSANVPKENSTRHNNLNIPLPPLVPVSPLIQRNVGTVRNGGTASSTTAAPTEKGRIYVANNLMQKTADKPVDKSANKPADKPVDKSMEKPADKSEDKTAYKQSSTAKPAAVPASLAGGTSVRGRPFGARRTGITKLKKQDGLEVAEVEVGIKCSMQGCAFRFKKPETLEYHRDCHNKTDPSMMFCPECNSTDFTNWNSLHTHLWRSHQIDMELYCCELCSFKTPIYSRLINTHAKIHSEDRNYKCDQCEKAFKNTKQLKNHRRWHRTHSTGTSGTTDSTTANVPAAPPELYRCSDCPAVFSHQKTLREHTCKTARTPIQCQVCGRATSSKSSLKLHMLTHEPPRRFKCSLCAYTANDHNAFRRHKMIHEIIKMYVCPHCSYKSIQSGAYQKHLQLKHPDMASAIIHKCQLCSYSTINRALFAVHQAKHESPGDPSLASVAHEAVNEDADCESADRVEQHVSQVQQHKIKVKSDLMLTATEEQSSSAADSDDSNDDGHDLLVASYEVPVV